MHNVVVTSRCVLDMYNSCCTKTHDLPLAIRNLVCTIPKHGCALFSHMSRPKLQRNVRTIWVARLHEWDKGTNNHTFVEENNMTGAATLKQREEIMSHQM